MFIAITTHNWSRSAEWRKAVREVCKLAPLGQKKKVLLYYTEDSKVIVSGMGDLVSKSTCVFIMKTEDGGQSWYGEDKLSVVDLFVKHSLLWKKEP